MSSSSTNGTASPSVGYGSRSPSMSRRAGLVRVAQGAVGPVQHGMRQGEGHPHRSGGLTLRRSSLQPWAVAALGQLPSTRRRHEAPIFRAGCHWNSGTGFTDGHAGGSRRGRCGRDLAQRLPAWLRGSGSRPSPRARLTSMSARSGPRSPPSLIWACRWRRFRPCRTCFLHSAAKPHRRSARRHSPLKPDARRLMAATWLS